LSFFVFFFSNFTLRRTQKSHFFGFCRFFPLEPPLRQDFGNLPQQKEEKPTLRQIFFNERALFLIFWSQKVSKKRDL
jgi:hypothetical protein